MGNRELDRQLETKGIPNSPEAEQTLLGQIVLNNELISQTKRLIKPSDLYNRGYRSMYICMLAADEAKEPIDTISLKERLQRMGELDACGGVMALVHLTDYVFGTTSVERLCEIIRQHSKARWLLNFAGSIQSSILDGVDADSVAKMILDKVGENVSEGEAKLRRPRSIEDLYENQALRLQMFHKGISDAIPTGFPEVDAKLLGGGLLPSLMYVFAGRPSMGKTTFALDVVSNMADSGRRIMVVTRETPAEMLLDRMIAAKSGIARFKISSGISERDYELALETLQSMRLTPIVIDDASTTIGEIDHWLSWFDRIGKTIEGIMLDYLQLMSGDGDGRTQEVSAISSGFKGLLTKWKIPGIAVSQLSRAPGEREPELHHLRESGQIEQDADAVLFLHGEQTEEDADFLVKELICKKQRDGPHFRREIDLNTELVTFRSKKMLGLPDRSQIEPRKAGTDEEELVRQKARAQAPRQRNKKPSEDEQSFDY
jgi:replicative DNA helicase